MNNCKDCGDIIPDTQDICKRCSIIRNLDNRGLQYKMDGNMMCCYDNTFINLQESIAGFGETKHAATLDYIDNLLKERD